jgi:uncharacterized protein with GYD domain
MATYVTLVHWTDQGVKNVQGLVQRARQFRTDCERRGIKVLGLYTTQGRCDTAIILEAPDEQTLMAELLALESLGNVRTETMRAFNETEVMSFLQKM